MAEPRNGKCTQPFTVLDLAGDQDNFLAFGVAGFCHGFLRLEKGAENSSSFVLSLSTSSTSRLRFSEVGNAGGVFPFAKMHDTGAVHKVRSVPPPVSGSPQPHWKEFFERHTEDILYCSSRGNPQYQAAFKLYFENR